MSDNDFKDHFIEVTTGLDVKFTGRRVSTVAGETKVLALYITYAKNYVLHTKLTRPYEPQVSRVDIYNSLEDFYESNILNTLTKKLLKKAGLKTHKYIE